MKLALILSVVIAPFLVQTASIPEQHEIDKDLVKFFIYTRSNPNRGDQVLWNFDNVDNTNFNPSKKTFVLIHGWTDSIKFAERFVDDLLDAEDCNIIGVDWNPLSPAANYPLSAQNSLEVGRTAGEFVVRLMDKTGLTHNKVHGIGHSLGAQAIGNFGTTITALTFQKVPRITGLDPARPYFETLDPGAVINKNDALFVDIIHTNSGTLTEGCLSFFDQLGHIDHYPAGGDHQPGCNKVCDNCDENDLLDMVHGCSHDRSIQYFIESINDGTFTGTECRSYADYTNGCNGKTQVMGYPCNSSPGDGKFFLDVNYDKPYSQG